jgi:integrase
MMNYNDIMLAHLWKRNGVYYAVWQYKGNPRQKSLRTKDKRQAQRRLNQFNRELIAGKVVPIRDRLISKLGDFRTRYLEYLEVETVKDEIKDSTLALSKTALDKAVKAWGEDKNLLLLNKDDLIFYQNHIYKNIKKTTVNKNYRHLKSALKTGQEWGVVNRTIYFPREWKVEKTIRYFTSEELKKLVESISDKDFADLVTLAAYSGLRSGEIVRLTAQDIDNPQGYMRITAEQKNRTESRIPINDSMRAILDRHHQDIGPIFKWKRVDHVSATFKRYATAAGFPDHRFHDLRHTFGAHLAIKGVDIVKIQELMRHKSIQSTMVYVKLHPASLVEASNLLDYGF